MFLIGIQKPEAHCKGVTPNHIRLRTKSPGQYARKLELPRDHSLDSERANQRYRQPAFAQVLHRASERLPNRSLKPHRQINLVSEISAMFALHLRYGDFQDAGQSRRLYRFADCEVGP